MEFVANEWLCEYFKFATPEENIRKLESFLNWFYQSDHQLIVIKDSPFQIKIGQIEKILRSHFDTRYHLRFKKFHSLLYYDPTKIKIINNEEFLPTEIFDLVNIVGTNFASDQYLFEAAIKSDSKIIVTTDQRLINHMGQSEHYRLIHLDNFIEDILK